MRTPETPLEWIRHINQSHFEVHSTNLDNKYEINLSSYTSTCSDFPRIQLCKHLAATIHFFEGEKEGEFGPQAPDNASEPDMPKSLVPRDGSTKSHASVIMAINDVARLAQEILEVAPANPDPEMAKSVQMAQSQLNAIQLSMNDSASRLPEKEQIAPQTIHMKQGSIPGIVLSLMQSSLLPTLEHAQPRRRQQNGPPCKQPP